MIQNHIKTSSCASANIIIFSHQMPPIYSEANEGKTTEHPLQKTTLTHLQLI